MLKSVLLSAALIVSAAYVATGRLGEAVLGARQPQPVAQKVEDKNFGVASLRADDDGHFRVEATIGGRPVPMLVDTGATVVALSYEQGQRLGLVSASDRFDSRVTTANGSVGAKRVLLRDVRVGSVKVDDVAAVVMSPGAMDGALLGMSFLGRLRRLETSRDRMVMER